MSYMYSGNVDPADAFDQIELQLDSGDTAILRLGHRYDLTAAELARARQYIVLLPSALSADEEPIGIVRLPVKGNPENGDAPIWNSVEAAFTPEALSGSGFIVVGTPASGNIISRNGSSWTSSDRLSVAEVGIEALKGIAPTGLRGSGIPADGSNQYAAIQAVLSAAGAAGGRHRVIHEGGTLRFDTPLTIPDGVELYLAQPESVLDGSNCAAQANLIAAGGTEDTQRLLTANAVPGATSVSIGAGFEAGILAGNWCRVGAQRLYAVNPATTGGVDQYIGELIQVESVASGLVTFKTPLDGGAYNTADSAFITKLTMLNETAVVGRGKIIGGGDAKSHRAIQFSRCTRPRAEGISIEGCTTSTDLGAGTGHIAYGNTPNSSLNVSSASTVTIPVGDRYVNMTGTTTINNITAQKPGTEHTIRFSASATLAHNGGGTGNIRLQGAVDYAGGVDRVVRLICDGTLWREPR